MSRRKKKEEKIEDKIEEKVEGKVEDVINDEVLEEKVETDEKEVVPEDEQLSDEVQEEIGEQINSQENDLTTEDKLGDFEVIPKLDMTERQKARHESVGKEDNLIKKDTSKKVAILIVSVIAAFVMLFLLFALFNRYNRNVYKNVYVMNTDCSNMSKQQVGLNLVDIADSIKKIKISVYQDEKEVFTIKPEEIEFTIDITKTEEKILAFGRDSNFFVDNFRILMAMLGKRYYITPTYSYDKAKLDNLNKNIQLSIQNSVVNDSYSIDEENYNLVIVRGKSGNSLNIQVFDDDILSLLKKNESNTYRLKLDVVKPSGLDVNEIYKGVYREAKDAYEDKNAKEPTFVKEVVGLNFDTLELQNELVKEINQQEGKTLNFKLKTIMPKVKIEDINYMLFKDKIEGLTTYFDPNQTARSNNLGIALSYLNNVIVMPGETFSYAKVIGDTTAQKGYQPAATFKAGTVVYELGGGICQTSSTLYYVALKANMEIVERHPHGLPVGYIKPSWDATIYGEILDLKFKNTRKYPVKIVTSFSPSGSLNISLLGTRQEDEYDIQLTSNYLYTIPFSTQYIYDDTMAQGTQIVTGNGVNGYVSEAYITKSLNGKVVYNGLLSKDKYSAQNKVIRVGTKAQ